MFDIGFSELLLVLIVGLVVLGPQRLPVAIRTVMGWIATIRGLAANVQNELSQELKLQELQESIKKAEQLNLQQLSPELSKTVEDLKVSADKIKADLQAKADATNTSFEQQVQELKSAVENQQILANSQDQQDKNSSNTAALSQQELSPEELAEIAEEGEPMLQIPEDYYTEDDLAIADDQCESKSIDTVKKNS